MLAKNKSKGFLAIVLVLFLLTNLMSMTAFAASDTMGFSVSPVMPENQTNPGLGYFDVLVKPDSKQTLQLAVSNLTDEPKTLDIGLSNASTAPSGFISYVVPDVQDESMKVPFVSIASLNLKDNRLEIGANEVLYIDIQLDIPKEAFEGVLLGGIRVTDITARLARDKAAAEKTDGEGMGVTISNEYEFAVAILLRESEDTVPPNFELLDVIAETFDYRASIVTEIRNPQPEVVKAAMYNATITSKSDNTTIFSVEDKKIDMAPSSTMKYRFSDDAGYGVKAGDYSYKGSIDFDGKRWDFEKDFTIKAEEAKEINSGALNQQPDQAARTAGIPVWAIIAIALVLLLLILLIVLLIKMNKRKND